MTEAAQVARRDTPLWTRQEVARALGISGLSAPSDFSGVSIDSRTLNSGEMFFAIRGDRIDGHDFVLHAEKAGAGLAVVEDAWQAPADSAIKLARVPDVLAALNKLAVAARQRSRATHIAITGSVGKTSSKDMLALALAATGRTHAARASFNNHWGVPLTLARLPADSRFGIFEIGMNNPGEITPLSQLVTPDIALITTVEAGHLGQFSSVEEIAAAKAEIFSGLGSSGIAVLNQDNVHYEFLKRSALSSAASTIIGFGQSAGADARLIDVSLQADCSVVRADILGDEISYKIGVAGQHFVMNSLAVLALVKLSGADLDLGALALADWQPPHGRGDHITYPIEGGDIIVIDESYNANPASMRAALRALALQTPAGDGRRIAVLGDMLELGEDGPWFHAQLAGAVADCAVHSVYTAGPMMESLYKALPRAIRAGHGKDADALRARLCRDIRPGDIVMIKGSNGSNMSRLVAALARHLRP